MEIVYNTNEVPEHAGFYYLAMYPGYAINTAGDVLRLNDQKLLTPYKLKPPKKSAKGGYVIYRFKRDGKKTHCGRHSLLCQTFKEKPSFEKPIVNHINGIPGDDRLENLEWCTYSQNTKHGYRNKLYPNKVVKVWVYVQSVGHVYEFESATVASEFMGVSKNTIFGRLRNSQGVLFDDGYAVKRDKNIDWQLSAVRTSPKELEVMSIDLVTKSIRRYDNVAHAAERTGLQPASIRVALKRPSNGFLDRYEFKFLNDDRLWTRISEEEVERRLARKDGKLTRQIKATSANDERIFESAKLAGEFFRRSEGHVLKIANSCGVLGEYKLHVI